MESWDLTTIEAPGGTVSPTVLATADGARAITILLEPGQALTDHQVRERAWVTVVEGHATVTCDGESVEAGTGTLLTFAPGERHAVASATGARLLLVLAP